MMENINEVLKGLYDLKSNLEGEKFELENKLYLVNCSLEDINKEICKVGGHSFDSWKQKLNPEWLNTDDCNTVFCYSRKCVVCGKEEISYKKPKVLTKKIER